ncbi:MAG: homocysteine S-methyltransferase family protein [Verrucomicrobiae bacterium]|nr:homocysteine S-methyltransferase family protein [Verrucomicrobiae bacterium]
MAGFLETLRERVLLCDGATGSLLFELTGRLSEPNHVYESFNVERPELVLRIHRAYLEAGARCLKTNTFGANRTQLHGFGLGDRVTEFNRAAVELARRAIREFERQRGATGPFFVLGSVGPASGDASVAYREQLEALVAAEVDALLLETFPTLEQLESVVDVARGVPGAPPIIAELTIQNAAAPADFVERMVARGVAVVGVNCCAPWDAQAFVEQARRAEPVREGRVYLVAMPNAGGFQRIGNRFLSAVNAEYMGRLARTFRDLGLHLIGGCCEVHPQHIREMHNYLESRRDSSVVVVGAAPAAAPVGPEQKRGNGPFSRKLFDGQFVVSVEVLPPRGTSPKAIRAKVDLVRRLAESGHVDAVDITDGSRGIPLMPPGEFIHLIRRELGWTRDAIELIPHFTARDLNTMGIQSRLIGYHAHRIHNVLFITGDPPKMAPTYPRSTAVFDLDSIGMIRLTHSCLNAGLDFGGQPLGKAGEHPPTHFTIGTGFEPEALDGERERQRLEQKWEAGADYVMTQPAFRFEPLGCLERYRDRMRILVGVMILSNLDHARRMAQVPGVVIPETILNRLAAYEDPSDQGKVARDIAVEQALWVKREGWAGLYVMAPAGGAAIFDVLAAVAECRAR